MGIFSKFKRKNFVSEAKTSEAADEPVDWESMYVLVDSIGIRGYQPEHFEECRFIWTNWVPKGGQADILQGELLREAVKLRNEACGNGNINWDDNFAWFCDNIYNVLSQSGAFSDEKCVILQKILEFIKENGEYAEKYGEGEISYEECDPVKLAYTDDDLYDYLEDAVAEFYMAYRKPIPYEKKEFIYR